ncbi:unnamed protein product [Euphydryas editha]|uniref:tRNA-splicing endonuclease subunit Sen54 N-terminal domain-containing protein n=1 Tax=Euphydryas editha TaxID=104508 RepID=A0AAU9V7U4_EUPED|nr:unnamed protein product [Euphydryas editha]
MDTEKILSGHELVSKGATKIEATLPEIGIKDVFPSGSWLEQKQIQSAVEARKHLIEVERIEKSGALSHAVWKEELMLAEITQKVGSYWQYLGHNKGKQLYLRPEEALFLMEINCLHLKYHDVKVSLQQAYSLLLRDKITLLHYKVYASLSRLGYRVYRHEKSERLFEKKHDSSSCIEKAGNNNTTDNNNRDNNTKETSNHLENYTKNVENRNLIENTPLTEQNDENRDNTTDEVTKINERNKDIYGLKKLQKLKSRFLKPCNVKHLHRFFNNLPKLTDKQIVSIKAPPTQYIPNNINLNKSIFNINLQNIQSKSDRSDANDTNIYTNDEVNGNHIRRLNDTSHRLESAPVQQYTNIVFANTNFQYRQLNFCRSTRNNYNSINFSMLYQRQFLWFFPSRFQSPRIQTQLWQTNSNRNFNDVNSSHNSSSNISNNIKRSRVTSQKQNLEEIKKLALRLKQIILSGNTQTQNIQLLQRLIQSYNSRYKTRVKLSDDFNIIIEETIVDTIELKDDDDDEPSRKRHRRSNSDDNLILLKKFALQLKELEKSNKSSARHRRAFSKLLRTFNESYNEEYCLSESYEIENRRQITLDSSDASSPECIKEEPKFRKRKKLRNPFNILKRLSEQQKESCSEASTSTNDNNIELEKKKYSELLLKTFTKEWLPPEDDFGRVEIVAKEDVTNEIIDIKREEFLFDFLKIQTCNCDNWLELKKSFFTSIKEAIAEFQSVPAVVNNRINSVVKPDDCTDMASILKKLRIIQNANKVDDECNLAIDFDVFNRDVQNFRKTKRPTPHFRIICFDEKKPIPSGSEIVSLHSKYDDNVIIVCAIVGIDSISYLQINPSNLPVYISNHT